MLIGFFGLFVCFLDTLSNEAISTVCVCVCVCAHFNRLVYLLIGGSSLYSLDIFVRNLWIALFFYCAFCNSLSSLCHLIKRSLSLKFKLSFVFHLWLVLIVTNFRNLCLQQGKKDNLLRFPLKVLLIYFFHTSCIDFCVWCEVEVKVHFSIWISSRSSTISPSELQDLITFFFSCCIASFPPTFYLFIFVVYRELDSVLPSFTY